jgi:hypothetical protein
MIHGKIVVATAFALAAVLFAPPAQAQRARVFVASYGSGSNPCTFGSPCKTFQHAHDAVAASGEISAIDSAGFGPLTITKSVTITSPPGIEAGIAAASGNSISVNAGVKDIVSLYGLTVVGTPGNNNTGIFVGSAGRFNMVDCVIRDFAGGVGLYVNSSNQAVVTLSNIHVTNNLDGIFIQSGSASVSAMLNHITLSDNTAGIVVYADNANAETTITNSDFSNNSLGVVPSTNGPATESFLAYVTLVNDNFNNNGNAIQIEGNTGLALSHVIDAYSINGSIAFNWINGTATYSDGTNHVSLVGSFAPHSLGSWSQQ